IGHDGDRPLLDEVADHRCGTPSIAAALVVPSEAELRAELDYWLDRAFDTIEGQVDRARRVLESFAPETALGSAVATATQRLERAESRLINAHPKLRLAACAARLDGYRATMHALDPARVLERGYAVVRTADGSVVRDAAQLASGDAVRVT